MRRIYALLAAAVLGVALAAASCGSAPKQPASQTVAWSASLPPLIRPLTADRPPECNTLRLVNPATGASIWLQFCGSGPGRESQAQDWTASSLAAKSSTMDGVTALTPANCPRTLPCVLIANQTPPS